MFRAAEVLENTLENTPDTPDTPDTADVLPGYLQLEEAWQNFAQDMEMLKPAFVEVLPDALPETERPDFAVALEALQTKIQAYDVGAIADFEQLLQSYPMHQEALQAFSVPLQNLDYAEVHRLTADLLIKVKTSAQTR